jgi:cytochrome oxidase complex assembly protein 1
MSEYGQPPPKKSGPWLWIGLGCGALALALVAFIGFIVIVVFGSIRSSTPYKESVALAQSDSRVTEALGTPVKAGYFCSGQINTNNNSGDANLSIPLHGPKGGGILEVKATKSGGTWTYQVMKVDVKGESYDLIR